MSAVPALRTLPGFPRYWGSTTMAGIASSVGGIVVPLVAVTETHANATEMALLAAAGSIPTLLLQIPAAVQADKPGRHGIPTLVLTDLASCALSLGLPVLWLQHRLSYPAVLALELLLALVGVIRFASQTPVLTSIVPADRLVDANGKLAGTRSATDIGGQGLAGAILSLVAQPIALLVNAAAYAISAGLLARIRPAAPPPTTAPTHSLDSAWRGVGPIVKRLLGRFDVATFCAVGLVGGLMSAVFMLYVVHDLHMTGNVIALCIATGALGGVLGGGIAGRLEQKLGAVWCVTLGAVLLLASVLPLLLAHTGMTAILATIGYEFFGALGGTLTLAATYGAVLGTTPHHEVSRTMAVMSNAGSLAELAGVAVGGVLGTAFSLQAPVLAAVVASAALGATALAAARHRSPSPAGEEISSTGTAASGPADVCVRLPQTPPG